MKHFRLVDTDDDQIIFETKRLIEIIEFAEDEYLEDLSYDITEVSIVNGKEIVKRVGLKYFNDKFHDFDEIEQMTELPKSLFETDED